MFNETFWVAVSITLFLTLVYKPIARVVVKALDERSDRIRRELEEAVRLKEEAQELLASYELKHKEAEDTATAIMSHAKEEAVRLRKEAEQDLETSLNRRIELAMEKIASYEATVLQEVRMQAVDIAMIAVRDLLSEHVTRESAETLIQTALQDAQKKLN